LRARTAEAQPSKTDRSLTRFNFLALHFEGFLLKRNNGTVFERYFKNLLPLTINKGVPHYAPTDSRPPETIYFVCLGLGLHL
jgi:hypothetical protein